MSEIREDLDLELEEEDVTEEENDSDIYGDSDSNEDNNADAEKVDTDIEQDADKIASTKIQVEGNTKSVSQSAYNAMKKNIEDIKNQLSIIDEKIKVAKADGDLSENSAYEDAVEAKRRLQAELDNKIEELNNSVIIDSSESSTKIMIDSYVDLTVTDPMGRYKQEHFIVNIQNGITGIDQKTGIVNMPTESEVFAKMKDRTDGSFDLIGTDGNNYHYEFKLLKGAPV